MPPVNPLVVLVLLSFVPSRERFPAHSQRCNDEKGQARHQASHPCTQLENRTAPREFAPMTIWLVDSSTTRGCLQGTLQDNRRGTFVDRSNPKATAAALDSHDDG